MSHGQSFDCPSRAPQPVLSRSVSPTLIITSSTYSPALSLMIEVIYRAQSHGFQLISFHFLSLREASLATVSLGFCMVLCSVYTSAVFGVQWTIITSAQHVLQPGLSDGFTLFPWSCPTSAIYHWMLVTQHILQSHNFCDL